MASHVNGSAVLLEARKSRPEEVKQKAYIVGMA